MEEIVVDVEDIINYIEEHSDKQISREVIDKVLQLEEDYLRSIGIVN